ncbi:MAG TPA: glycosyltransferase family 39 protein [Myxococcota bacterium]|nr:glycosyltransferase family 39 protein [Myxococcota bacterium]
MRESISGDWEARRSKFAWRALGASLIVVLYLAVGVFDHELWPPIEQAVAGVTWEMYTHDEIAVPKINGIPYLEKPPLAYTLSWLSCKIAGRLSAGFVRLPAALCGLLSLAVLFWISRRLYGEAVAWISTYLCATTFTFYDMMHRASSDSVALFFIILCFALFLRTLDTESSDQAAPANDNLPTSASRAELALASEPHGKGSGEKTVSGEPRRGFDRTTLPIERRPRSRARWLEDLPFCLALAASFYAKNFYTFLIVVPPVTVFLVMTRQFRRLFGIGATAAVALALLVGPWCYALYAKGGLEYLRIVFFDNTLGRFFTFRDTTSLNIGELNDAFRTEKSRPPFGVARWVSADMLPWPFIYGGALWDLFLGHKVCPRRLFLKIAFIAIIVSLSLSSSRQMTYFLPIVFVLSLVSAEFFHDLLGQGRQSTRRRQLVALNLAVVVIGFALAPLGAGLLLHNRSLIWLFAPNLVAVAALGVMLKGRWHEDLALWVCGVVIACSAWFTLAFAIPPIDELRSWRPFFAQVRTELEGRRIFTPLVNDRRLPAMNFYLDRRLEILKDSDQIPLLLGSPEKVGIVVSVNDYNEQRDRLAKIPHRAIRASKGADLFVFLENP